MVNMQNSIIRYLLQNLYCFVFAQKREALEAQETARKAEVAAAQAKEKRLQELRKKKVFVCILCCSIVCTVIVCTLCSIE